MKVIVNKKKFDLNIFFIIYIEMISIYCFKDVNDEIIYVGSTKDIRNRYDSHKSNCYNENNIPLYQYMRDNNGIHNFKFIKICDVNEEFRKITEKFYIDTFKPKCNTNNVLLNTNNDKEYYKERYNIHKEKIKVRRDMNKDKLKIYRDMNKERFYKKRSEDRICCRACRCEIRRDNLKQHLQTQKHINNL